MKETTKFCIENKTFVVSSKVETENRHELLVQSAPRPYKAIFSEQRETFVDIHALLTDTNNCLLVDEKVFDLYKKNFNFDVKRIFKAPATETFKTLEGVTQVLNFLQDNNFTKGETLVVVGGGIIQDVGAFVAACYKRGIKWIYYPTTLLSMSDSCIGSKSSINYGNAKNQLGLFSAPREVVINPNFLRTLEFIDLQSGLGEILKLLAIGGKDFLNIYMQHVKDGRVDDFGNYVKLIFASLSVKKAVIEADEFEFGCRKSLNYGHTLGHAIETLSNYEISHGQGVVIGMVLVNQLSNQRNLFEDVENAQLKQLCFELLNEEVISLVHHLDIGRLKLLISKDKKTEGGVATLVVLRAFGKVGFLKLPIDQLLLDEISVIIKENF
jgi:3-dehydroquinate synthase